MSVLIIQEHYLAVPHGSNDTSKFFLLEDIVEPRKLKSLLGIDMHALQQKLRALDPKFAVEDRKLFSNERMSKDDITLSLLSGKQIPVFEYTAIP